MPHHHLPERLLEEEPAGRPRQRLPVLAAATLLLLDLLAGSRAWATDITSCPYTITTPGSYTVTRDLTCGTNQGKGAITILANNVTLSLGGHTLTGPGTTTNTYGVAIENASGVTVGGGTIANFASGAYTFMSTGCSVSGLTIRGCEDAVLLDFATTDTTIENNTLNGNGNGVEVIAFNDGSTSNNDRILNNTASGNRSTGIGLDEGSTGNVVTGNTALGNGVVDLFDANDQCKNNVWMDNCFGTESKSCIGTSSCGAVNPITCPSNKTVTAAAGQATASVDAGMPATTPPGLPVVGVRADGKALTDPYPLGVTMIHWTVNPGQENAAHCDQTVTVLAAGGPAPPNLACPGNKSVTIPLGQHSATVPVGTATSTTEGATIVGVRSDGKPLTAPYPAGTTTITWMATLDELPPVTCTQTITVQAVNPFPSIVRGPGQADPVIESIRVDRGPLYQRAIVHGHGFADVQGTSFVTLGGQEIPVLDWTDDAIAVLINPMAFDQAALALNAAYPVQVVIPANGKKSNTVEFFLTDGPPAPGYPNIAAAVLADPLKFQAIQPTVVCPGGTVWFLGSGFGAEQGSGYVSVQVPLADGHGAVVRQEYAEPVLGWTGSAVNFALLLPGGAMPGMYTATMHRSGGPTATGSFLVETPDRSGPCVPVPR